jgi:hypothetical protein
MANEHWQIFLALAGLVAAWSLVIIASLRIMFTRSLQGVEEKVETFGETQKAFVRLERELMDLKADMPLIYVRREDFIRFDVVINNKLDKLRDLVVEALREKKS